MKKTVISLILISNIVFGLELTSNDTKDLSITIYNDNFGLVKETREISTNYLREKEIKYLDVAQLIESDSVIFEGLDILEMNYEYDLINKNKLLNKYIDKTISIKKENEIKRYKLLSSNNNELIVQNIENGNIIIDPEGTIILPKLPNGLQTTPTLVVNVDKIRSKDIGISYLTKGISWEADYIMNLNYNSTLDLVGWVEIKNSSGINYNNANLKLVAGDVNRVQDGYVGLKRAVTMEAAADRNFKEKSFFDYHLYTLDRRTNIKNNQDKEIEFISIDSIRYKKYYTFSNYNPKVKSMIKIINSNSNSMGIPLPKGKIKLYKENRDDNSLEFIGEDKIDHTSKGEEIKIQAGNAFDVIGEYKELDYNKFGNYGYEKTVQYTVKNNKKEKIDVEIELNLNGEWEILNSSEDYIKINSRKVIFPVTILPEKTKILELTYHIKR